MRPAVPAVAVLDDLHDVPAAPQFAGQPLGGRSPALCDAAEAVLVVVRIVIHDQHTHGGLCTGRRGFVAVSRTAGRRRPSTARHAFVSSQPARFGGHRRLCAAALTSRRMAGQAGLELSGQPGYSGLGNPGVEEDGVDDGHRAYGVRGDSGPGEEQVRGPGVATAHLSAGVREGVEPFVPGLLSHLTLGLVLGLVLGPIGRKQRREQASDHAVQQCGLVRDVPTGR